MDVIKLLARGIVTAACFLGLLFLVYFLVLGRQPSLGLALATAAWVGVMAMNAAFRRSHNLDPNPSWLMIGIGGVGLLVCAYWLSSQSRPVTPGERGAFAVILSVPVGMLIYGIRQMRRESSRRSAESHQTPGA